MGRTQTCGMPTQRLALRLDCLLKPRELGFIAGAPPEEKLWRKAGERSVYVSRESVWAWSVRIAKHPHSPPTWLLWCVALVFALATNHLSSIFGTFCLIFLIFLIKSFLLLLCCDISPSTECLRVCQHTRQRRHVNMHL